MLKWEKNIHKLAYLFAVWIQMHAYLPVQADKTLDLKNSQKSIRSHKPIYHNLREAPEVSVLYSNI